MTSFFGETYLEADSIAAHEHRTSSRMSGHRFQFSPLASDDNTSILSDSKQNSAAITHDGQYVIVPDHLLTHRSPAVRMRPVNGEEKVQKLLAKPVDITRVGAEEDESLLRWTLSPSSSVQSPWTAEIAFVHPPTMSTEDTWSFSGSASSEVRVETGLLSSMPRELRISPNRIPCGVFALIDLSTGRARWHFVKEYEQLSNFNDLIQYLLVPIFKETRFRLRDFPSRDLFQSTVPWKVDLRNDMLNAYFRSFSWLCDNDAYKKNKPLQNMVERAVHALWLYDKVEPSPMRSFGIYGEEMCGYLLTRARTQAVRWNCQYYAMNGSFLDIVKDLKTGELRDSICLYKAYIEQLIVFYEATEDNARYAINIYETTATGRVKLHTLCAENERVRQQWLLHLRRRVSHLTLGDISNDARSKTKIPPLPYVLPLSPQKSPYLPDDDNRERLSRKRNAQNILQSFSSDSSELSPSLFSRNSDDWSFDDGAGAPVGKASSQISVRDISNPILCAEMRVPPSTSQGSLPRELSENALSGAETQITSIQLSPSDRFSAVNQHRPIAGNMRKTNSKQSKAGGALVFGVMPDACKHQVVLNNGDSVPSVVARCLEVLQRRRTREEVGIFRISGTQTLLDELEAEFNAHGDFDMLKAQVDVHTTADLLKRYLRFLPERLLKEYPESKFQYIRSLTEPQQKETLKADVSDLEPANCAVLRAVMALLYRVSRKESKNAMGLRNLGVALSPGLRVPGPILEMYIKWHESIFEPAFA